MNFNNIDIDNIDYEKLREDLTKYFEGDIFKNPFGNADVLSVRDISDQRLLLVALCNQFDLNEYQKGIER